MTHKFTLIVATLLALFAMPGWAQTETYTVTLDEDISHGTLTINQTEFAEGETVILTATADEGYGLLEFDITKTDDGSDTDIIPLHDEASQTFVFAMPAFDVTVSATFNVMFTYTRVTNPNELIPGADYILVGEKDGKYYIMDEPAENDRPAVEIEGNEMTATALKSTLHQFTISGDPTNLYTFYDDKNFVNYGFLCASSSENDALTLEYKLDDHGIWTIAIDPETGEANIVAQGGNTHNTLRFNADGLLFSCYEGNANSPVYIYRNDDTSSRCVYSNTITDNISDCSMGAERGAILTVTGTIQEDVLVVIVDESQLICDHDVPYGMYSRAFMKYNAEGDEHTGGWNLVALPINAYNVLPGTLIMGEYELYSFDEPTLSWTDESDYSGTYFPLPLGPGYLFAMPSSNPQGRFGSMGTLQGSKDDLNRELSYTESDNNLKGFNLVGNPFPCTAYANMDYMVLDETGTNFIVGNVIKAGHGILVQATAPGQEVTFSRNAPETPDGFIEIGLSQNEGAIFDNLRIFLTEGHRMSKIYMSNSTSSLYVAQDNDRLGVTSAQPQGELPIHFDVNGNGSYTLTVSTNNVEVQYLHLIDNIAGTDIDLLANPSYTFNAETGDYASRFKLVFTTAGVEENNSTASFAYMRGNDLVIDNIEGNATLQITDMMGRTISAENVSGNYAKTLNVAPGIYIINLNGMTQKIVVR